MFHLEEIELNDGSLITNIRHKEQIRKALKSILEGEKGVDSKIPIDLIEIALKDALEALSEITGENVSEDIINEIFSKFCLGK